MRYGVSYYPEHKNPEELKSDIKLLKESAINTVRMGEFAWSRMEPEEGIYDFEWLKDIVRELGEAGIHTILCTPTACPPAWLIEKYPDILYMDNRRIRRPFGGRRHYCYNNEDYREYSLRITASMGRAFAGNPHIAGVQIDNEPAQEGTGRCCCPVCESKFRKWLAVEFGSIEEFNRRSGSIFWSQEYQSFEQIQIPVNTIEPGAVPQIRAYYENPTIRLLFERFSSNSQKEYQDLQARLLRKYLTVPITTNGTGLATNSIDYYDSTRELDCYAFDYYPDLRDARVDSFPYAFARGIKPGVPFWILEFMSGGGHRLGGSGRLQPNPGALKQSVVHSLAHGGQMMLHFQFRTYPFGAEQLNYAIVDMDGIPRRRYYEMKDTAELLKKLEPLEMTSFPGEAAICFDYNSHWALRLKPVNDPEFHYIDYCGKLYRHFEEIGINADVISLNADFSRYKLIMIPTAIIITPKQQQKIKQFVKEGGTVIATFLTSVKNEDNVGYTTSLPAGLTDLFGSTVEEVEPVFAKNHTKLSLHTRDGVQSGTDQIWSELLSGPSKALGVYEEDYKSGEKMISAHIYGEGHAYYVGTDLNEELYHTLLTDIAQEANINMLHIGREKNVEAICRYGDGKCYLILFNFTGRETVVTLPEGYRDYMTGESMGTNITITRNGFVCLYKSIGN